MKTLRFPALLLVAALPFAASAAPTVNTLGGDTRVQLSGDLTGALTSLGVSVKASYPARLRAAVAACDALRAQGWSWTPPIIPAPGRAAVPS